MGIHLSSGPLSGGRARQLAVVVLLLWIAVNVGSTWLFLARSDPWDTSDSAYYYARAREIATEGKWSRESIIASHLTRHPTVEHPAFDHWQPATAVIVGGFGRLLGDTETAARVTIFVAGSLILPLLAGLYVRLGGGTTVAALLAAALVLSVSRLDTFRTVLDSTILAAALLAAAATLWAIGILRPARVVPWVAAAAGAALGMLAATRGEGLPVALLLIAVMTLLAPEDRRRPTARWLLVGLGLTLLPFLGRNVIQFGQLFPPGASRTPWLVSFSEWGAFLPGDAPGVGALIGARVEASARALSALLRTPEIVGAVLAILIAVISGGDATGGRRRVDGRRAAIFPLSAFAVFTAIAILLAPALTLWRHRSPIPYLPLLFAGGVLAADILIRQGRSAVSRRMGIAIAGAAVLALLTSPPQRLALEAGRRVPERYAAAARSLPRGSIVMTDAPLPLYVEHRGGVVRLPNDGKSAIVAAIHHYRTQYLVLFDEPVGPGVDEVVAGLLEGSDALGPSIELDPVESTPRYRVWRIRTTEPP